MTSEERVDTFQRDYPNCPGCGYELDGHDMDSHLDLYDLAHAEDSKEIECPKCDAKYWVLGGWKPHFTTAWAEEDLW